MDVTAPNVTRRNPGPSWGYRFLRMADRIVPEIVYRPLRMAGTFIGWSVMREQRRHSREYLAIALGRRPRAWESFRHFWAFEEVLMTKLRVANGRPHRTVIAPGGEDFQAWLEQGGPVLLGTFHFGASDLQGCLLPGHAGREVYVLRHRVGNSDDIDWFAEQQSGRLRFLWVNDPAEAWFALKEAAGTPAAIALQCDRVERTGRNDAFEFLGARRLFPVTIYELARVFRRPVLLSVGVPHGADRAVLHASPRFDPVLPGESPAAARQRARRHFQAFLHQVEGLLRANPYLWFNFTPMNPPAPAQP